MRREERPKLAHRWVVLERRCAGDSLQREETLVTVPGGPSRVLDQCV